MNGRYNVDGSEWKGKRTLPPGYIRCRCGRKISSNKTQCLACSKENVDASPNGVEPKE